MDYIAINLTEGDFIKIETYFLNTSTDTVVRLYNSAQAQVAYDDGGVGLYSKLEWICDATGTCYIRINEFSSDTGDYSIDVIAIAPPSD